MVQTTDKTSYRIPSLNRLPWCVILNIITVYAIYMICRILLVAENHAIIAGDILHGTHLWHILVGSLRYDTSAIFYTNLPYLLLVLLPLQGKAANVLEKATKWTYVTINSISVITNLFDCIYYPYTQRRMTMAMREEFGHNTNAGSVASIELINHWYLVLAAVLLIIGLVVLYRPYIPHIANRSRYYVNHALWLVVFGALTVVGMRGGLTRHPISITETHKYVDDPSQEAIVVNTPFSLITTLHKKQVNVPRFYESADDYAAIYTSVHLPSDTATADKKNVVIFIVESFAEEFIGSRNSDLDGGTYKGYTTFIDSLLQHAVTFEHTYSNSWVSIDAMPAVISSIPKMYNPFVLTPYFTDSVPSLVKELKTWGYHSAFFHGAENTSMGFQDFAKKVGYDNYYGRTEYEADSRFSGAKDFDGIWAIWDEEFLQYYCTKISEMPEPFISTVFTATSHHPFAIPERYRNVYKDEGLYKIHKCIRYTDNALRQFFNSARKQPWFENTLFVICADHASGQTTHKPYMTSLGKFRIPIIFYDPSGKLQPGTYPGIAQQIDIMPTVLGYLGYDKPYVAFGTDLLSTAAEDTWAYNWHNIPQYIKGDYLLQFDDYEVTGLYKYTTDPLLEHNLMSSDLDKPYVQQMLSEVKALMQDIDTREKSDNLRK